MKIFLSLLFFGNDAEKNGRRKLERGFLNAQRCLATDDITSNVRNGDVSCSGNVCQLKCENNFTPYGGPPKVKCKQHTSQKVRSVTASGVAWTKQIGRCETCKDINLDDLDTNKFLKSCQTKNGKRTCAVSCKNKAMIEPIMKRKAVVGCKCIWNRDKDGWCHWRFGARVVDNPGWTKFYHGGWKCGPDPVTKKPDRPIRTTAETTTEMAQTIKPQNFRIPKGLICRDQGNRIVGGMEAIPNSWPWTVRIYFGFSGCGGTIVDDKTVVTAAHCCRGYQTRFHQINIVVGEHDTMRWDLGQFTATVENMIMHPGYQQSSFRNDICILKTSDMNLRMVHTAAPACLPPSGWHPSVGTRCYAAGWGRMNDNKQAVVLQEVDLDIISDERCENTPNAGVFVRDEMFCAGHLTGGKDACQGDSGGPLVCVLDEQPILVGVTSWGLGCGQPNSPGVWTKVVNYVPWIRENMSNN